MAAHTPRSREAILAELQETRNKLQQLEEELASLRVKELSKPTPRRKYPLSLREYQRYGRQMILPSVGLQGQLKLKQAHILVIGAGGLGCPVLLYLAAAGVGEITILDHDSVELSNLHRQVLHAEDRIGLHKAQSAKFGLERLNSDVKIHAHALAFTPSLFHDPTTPQSIIKPNFSLILDCTDNPATRHFLNSYAVAHNIPLVSGGAVRTEGTVGVFGLPLPSPAPSSDPSPSSTDNIAPVLKPTRGPCYACVFPQTPAPSVAPVELSPAERQLQDDLCAEKLALQGTGACSDEGVVGILCGQVGVQMGAEAMRVLLGIAKPTLHLLSPLSPSPLRTIKLRAQKPTCPACGSFDASLEASASTATPRDTVPPFFARSTPLSRWTAFLLDPAGRWPGWEDPLCELPGVGASGVRREGEKRLRVSGLASAIQSGARIVDVRSPAEFGICHLDGSINIPFPTLLKDPSSALSTITSTSDSSDLRRPIHLICRRGNDSLLAARALTRHLASQPNPPAFEIADVIGGITAWNREVDPEFPMY